jgi:hypothetical protein
MQTKKGADTANGDITSEVLIELQTIKRRMAWLITAVFLVALALLFVVSAVFGAIVDFHYGESLVIGGACASGAVMGFLFGWLARRAI